MRNTTEQEDPITREIIGKAIAIHRVLGPGLLESVYEQFLAHELRKSGLKVLEQPAIGVEFDGIKMDLGFRPDMIIDDQVIVEIKAIQSLLPVHHSQLLSYLRLTNLERGLLINFHSYPLKDGIKRLSLTNRRSSSAPSAYLGALGDKTNRDQTLRNSGTLENAIAE